MFNLDRVMRQPTKELFLKLNSLKETSNWVLVGGTALALHIEHRISEDLDFFTNSHKMDKKLERNIDEIIIKLKEKGSHIELLLNDEQQKDFIINGVKVTFHTVASINLDINECKNKYEHGFLNIASVDVLAAMKMQTILKHRIKSRDFYDVYRLLKNENITLSGLLSNMKKYYPNENFSEKAVEMRFLKTLLSSNDEGLESVVKDDICDFKSLRAFYKDTISSIYKNDAKISEMFGKNINDVDMVINTLNHRFGLDFSTPATFLAKSSEFNSLSQLLGAGVDINSAEKNLSGKSVFHYLIESQNYELFKMALEVSWEFPSDLKKYISSHHCDKKFLDALNHEKIVNRAIKNLNNNEKIKAIASARGIDFDILMEFAQKKSVFLREAGLIYFQSVVEIDKEFLKMSDEQRSNAFCDLANSSFQRLDSEVLDNQS